MASLLDSTLEELLVTGDSAFNGSLMKPNLPVAVLSKSNGGTCYSILGAVPFNVVELTNNVSLSNSNSRVTVPYSGKYFVFFWTIGQYNCGTTYGRLHIRRNGVNVTAQARADHSVQYGNSYCFAVVEATAGDYFEAVMTEAPFYFNAQVYNKFIVYKAN